MKTSPAESSSARFRTVLLGRLVEQGADNFNTNSNSISNSTSSSNHSSHTSSNSITRLRKSAVERGFSHGFRSGWQGRPAGKSGQPARSSSRYPARVHYGQRRPCAGKVHVHARLGLAMHSLTISSDSVADLIYRFTRLYCFTETISDALAGLI